MQSILPGTTTKRIEETHIDQVGIDGAGGERAREASFAEGDTARVIGVTYDAESTSLEFDGSGDLDLESGETIVWQFSGVPAGWHPRIHFLNGERQGLGPFVSFRLTEDRVWAQGNFGAGPTEAGDEFTYQAVIFQSEGPGRISSDSAQLRNTGSRASNPKVVVTVDLDQMTFVAEPERFSIFDGDVVTFLFEGLPQDYAPAIVFESYESFGSNDPGPSPHTGPFTTIAREENVIVASGSNQQFGSFDYFIVVVHLVDGSLVSKKLGRSGDPVIDREEDPIYPTRAKPQIS